jgi:hypothetical protein
VRAASAVNPASMKLAAELPRRGSNNAGPFET